MKNFFDSLGIFSVFMILLSIAGCFAAFGVDPETSFSASLHFGLWVFLLCVSRIGYCVAEIRDVLKDKTRRTWPPGDESVPPRAP